MLQSSMNLDHRHDAPHDEPNLYLSAARAGIPVRANLTVPLLFAIGIKYLDVQHRHLV